MHINQEQRQQKALESREQIFRRIQEAKLQFERKQEQV